MFTFNISLIAVVYLGDRALRRMPQLPSGAVEAIRTAPRPCLSVIASIARISAALRAGCRLGNRGAAISWGL